MEQNAQNASSPAFALGQYKGLTVERSVRPVSEKAVEFEVRQLARVKGPYAASGKPARGGDRVVLDFEGYMDGEPIPDSQMTNIDTVLGEGKLMPDAERAILGHSAGEEFSFDFTYPADFRIEELAGKTAQFKISLHSVESKTALPIDDNMAQSLGYASLEAMKDAIRKHKTDVHEANADRVAEAKLLDMAGANCTVEIPDEVISKLAAQSRAQLDAKLKRSTLNFGDYCKNSNTTPEQIDQNYRRDAERRIRNAMATKAIAEAENITVSNAEVDAEYKRLAKLHGTPEEEIRKVIAPQAIAANVAARKVQEFLLANANVVPAEYKSTAGSRG